jgi:hypothetical protein
MEGIIYKEIAAYVRLIEGKAKVELGRNIV